MTDLRATFRADFSDFYAAVTQANGKLSDFQSNSSQVQTALDRMTDKFSGRKVVQEATIMAKAIQDLGGVSTLTAKELEEVGTKANEAVAKLTAMGTKTDDIPASLRSLAAETKGFTAAGTDMTGMLKGAAAAFGVSFSASMMVGMVKQLMAAADAMVTLSDRTGLTIEEVQKLTAVAGTSGVTIDDMTGAISALQTHLDDIKSQAALKNLGIDLEKLKTATPYEQLQQVMRALGGIQDPAFRAQQGVEIMGKTFTTVASTAATDWEGTTSRIVVASEQQVRALNSVGTAIGNWGRDLSNAGVAAAGAMVLAAQQMQEQGIMKTLAMFVSQGGPATIAMLASIREATLKTAADTAKAQLFPSPPVVGLEKFIGTLQTVGTGYEALNKVQQESVQKHKEWEEAIKELAAVGTNYQATLAKMNQTTVAAIEYYLKAGVSQGALATAYGQTASQIKAVDEALKAKQKAMENEQKDIGITNALIAESGKVMQDRLATTTDRMINDIDRWYNAEVSKIDFSTTNWRAHYDAIAQIAQERMAGISVNWDQVRANSLSSLQDTATRAQATYEYMAGHADQFSQETIEAFRKASEAAQKNVESWNQVGAAADDAGKKAKKAGEDAGAGVDQAKPKVDALAQSFAVLSQSAEAWRAQAAGLLADAARNEQSGAFGIGWSGSQIAQDQRAQAARDMERANRQESLDRTIGSMNAGAGQWQRNPGLTVTVNAMQGLNGDQIASALVTGMRQRGISPGGF